MITDLLVTEPPAGCPMGTGHAPFIVHGYVIDGIGWAELLEGVCVQCEMILQMNTYSQLELHK